MRKLDPKILRIGDQARIINPDIFVRCGYPLSLNDIRESHEFKDLMIQAKGFFESKFCASSDEHYLLETYSRAIIKGRVESELENFVARLLMRRKGFGGAKRSIHTKFDPRLKNAIVEIRGKKSVVTGEYKYGWYSDGDGESSSLRQTGRHIIYDVNMISLDENSCPEYFSDCWVFEIEKKNLDKIAQA